MKILYTFFFFAFLMSHQVNGQKKHAIYGELLGSGLIYSLNYDHRISENIKGWGFSVGFEYIPTERVNNGVDFISIPFKANYIIGNQPHYLEIAAGGIYIGGDAYFLGDYSFERGFGFTSSLMYRLQLENGFLLKIGVSSVFTKAFHEPIFPGLALGYAF
jgi:hypothetical protein